MTSEQVKQAIDKFVVNGGIIQKLPDEKNHERESAGLSIGLLERIFKTQENGFEHIAELN